MYNVLNIIHITFIVWFLYTTCTVYLFGSGSDFTALITYMYMYNVFIYDVHVYVFIENFTAILFFHTNVHVSYYRLHWMSSIIW